jgi:hypothetical protein
VEPIRRGIEGFLRGRYGYEGQQAFWVLLVPVLIGAILLVGWSLFGPLLTIPRLSTEELVARPGDYSSGIVAEPRLVPKPKTCSDYANERQILLDEQAGKLTKADKQWLDMDGDGRYCEERGVAWKGERSHTD